MYRLGRALAFSKKFYPENQGIRESAWDRLAGSITGWARRWWWAGPQRLQEVVARVNEAGVTYINRDERALADEVTNLRGKLQTQGIRPELVWQAFALVREFAHRRLNMRHFDVQLMGGWVLLLGMVAEMETGEGKTLVATLPACTAALAGIPVHIITVNDYLARRDAEWMGPIYASLGLRVGVVTQGMTSEERQKAYGCEITYCTNKEIVFDYLRDRLMLGQKPGPIQMRLERLSEPAAPFDRLCLRGLYYAIVDEADSILIDEARTPLIISGQADTGYAQSIYREALELARQLRPDEDYSLDILKKTLTLTETGREHLKELCQSFQNFWQRRSLREELVRLALMALHVFSRDKEYLIKDNKVQIIDEYTGRLMAGRSWERGLHQMIEIKEGCEPTPVNETLARISYQRFFRRYLHLAGMTGTASEVSRELLTVYGLPVVRVPTHRPLNRRGLRPRIFVTAAEKWDAIVTRIADLHRQGRPVLVGTRSVAASEYLSRRLIKAGLPHKVLNARQDKEEAAIVAQAGQAKQITVATNMAGRGTDILLGPGVKELGGLHVIATERHEARRIDRQLCGRCGRQGDPGTYEIFASLEDEVLAAYLANNSLARLGCLWIGESSLGQRLGSFLATLAQRAAERKHFQMRCDLLKFDESLEEALAFAGPGE